MQYSARRDENTRFLCSCFISYGPRILLYLPIFRRDLQSYCYVPVSVPVLPTTSSAGDLILPSYSYLSLMIIEEHRSGVLQIQHGKRLFRCGYLRLAAVVL